MINKSKLTEIGITREVSPVIIAYSFVIIFTFLYFDAVDYRGVASSFPTLTLRVGIILAVVVSINETIYYIRDNSNDKDANKYLRGTSNKYNAIEQVKRVGAITIGVVTFILLWNFDILFAVAVSNVLSLYLLGVRNIGRIVASTASLIVFIFVVFIHILGVPIGVI